jgi:PAS domain S-box-containing protein
MRSITLSIALQILAASLGSIIQRRRDGEQLRVSDAQYRMLFDINPHPMWVYEEANLRMLAVNRAAVDHYGYSEQASLLDKAKDPIVVRGIDNRVQFWNKGAERLYGWSAAEVAGRSVEDLLYHDPDDYCKATCSLMRQGEWSGEIRGRRKDGSALTVEANWTLFSPPLPIKELEEFMREKDGLTRVAASHR